MALHEDACKIKYSTWPATGLTIVNEGRAGTAYNGTAAANKYALLPSGVTSFALATAATDMVVIPTGTGDDGVIDNLKAHTHEFVLYYNAATAANEILWGKAIGGTSSVYYYVQITSTNGVAIKRFAADGVAYEQWSTASSVVAPGNYYTIQVAWDATTVATTPVVYINGVAQSLTYLLSGVVATYWDDSTEDVYLGNRPTGGRLFSGNLILYRLHTRALTPPELIDNYNCDKWRTEVELQYDFSQDASPILNDINPSVYPMTISGAVKKELADGACHAYYFDGSNDYALIPHDRFIDNKSEFSLEFVVSTSARSRLLWSKGPQAAGTYFSVRMSSTGLVGLWRETSGGGADYATWTTGGSDILPSAPTHLVVTFSGSNPTTATAHCYFDGVEKTLTKAYAGATTTWFDNSAYDMRLADDSGAYSHLEGTYYLFRYHGRVLSQTEARAAYEKELWRYSSDAGCDIKYDFSEESGTTIANDIRPGTNDLTLTHAPVKTELGYGGAHSYYFDGTNDYGTTTSQTLLNNFSIEIIFKVDTTSNKDLVGQWEDGVGGFKLSYVGSTSQPLLFIKQAASYMYSSAIDPTKYNHLVFTVAVSGADSVITSYINGVYDLTATKAGVLMGSTANALYVANNVSAYGKFKGYIAFIRIYNGRTLSAADVLEAYNQEKWRYSDTGLTLTIDKKDYSCFIKPSTFHVIDQLEGRNTGSFETIHPTNPKHGVMGQPLVVTNNDTKLYEGFITGVTKQEISDISGFHYQYKIADYTTFATRRLIAWNYEDMSADDIVLHINTYFLNGEGISAVKVASGGYVEAGVTLDKAVFNYIPVSQALDQLAEQCGYSWYIDYDKNLHFFPRTSNVAPWNIYDGAKGYSTFNADTTQDQYRNRQWIQGGTQDSEPRTEVFSGDGKLTSFKMMYQLSRAPTITVDGVAQTVGIQGVDTDKDWYWSDNSDTITQAPKVEPYKEFSSIEYDFSDDTDAALKNRSEAGVGLDAVTYDNDYQALSTGAGCWRMDEAADYIKIPKNVVIDNLQQVTMEWILWWGVSSTYPRLWDKGSDFVVLLNNDTNCVDVVRHGIGGGTKQYRTPANSLVTGHYYHIQMVWDCMSPANLPVIYINGVKQPLTSVGSGTVTAFISDSASDAYIGNRSAKDRPFYGAFLLFRLYRSSVVPPMAYPDPDTLTTGLLTEEQLRQNYLAERWRYTRTGQGDVLEQNQKISVTYQYTFPLLDVVDSTANQATQAALETTGSGIYETIENDGTLNDTNWAIDKATRLLAKYGPTAETIKFATNRTGLKAGQLIYVTLPDLYINNVAYLITEVELADESFVQYEYTVTASSGESLGSWAKFFTDEAAKGRTFKINEGQTLLLLTRSLETLTVTDTLSTERFDRPAHTVEPTSLVAVETDCQVKYTTWPAAGTAIDNEMGDATYDGVAAENDYLLQPSGATSFKLNDGESTDYVRIPKGAAINNFVKATWEWKFYLNGLAGSNGYLLNKGPAGVGVLIYIAVTGVMAIRRYDNGGTNYRQYQPTSFTFAAGHNYDVQITWDCTGYAAAPVMYVSTDGGPLTAIALTNASSGATDAWYDDSAYDTHLFNRSDLGRKVDGTLYLFRWHDEILTPAQLATNYYADYWRYNPTAKVGFSECLS